MTRLCAQGDILIERVDDAPVSGAVIQSVDERIGDRRRRRGDRASSPASLARSRCIATTRWRARFRPVSTSHMCRSKSPTARLEHEEHAPIALEQGTYRVRRQRQLEPTDIGIHEHFSTLED